MWCMVYGVCGVLCVGCCVWDAVCVMVGGGGVVGICSSDVGVCWDVMCMVCVWRECMVCVCVEEV